MFLCYKMRKTECLDWFYFFSWHKSINWWFWPVTEGKVPVHFRNRPRPQRLTKGHLSLRQTAFQHSIPQPADIWEENRRLLQTFSLLFNPPADIQTPHEAFSLPSCGATPPPPRPPLARTLISITATCVYFSCVIFLRGRGAAEVVYAAETRD